MSHPGHGVSDNPLNIPGYQLGRKVAASPVCDLYNALNLNDNTTVSIQVFNPALATDNSFRDELKSATERITGRRFGIMASIRQAMVSKQACYLIADYFPGPEQQENRLHDLSVKQMLKLGLSLASTLTELHQAGQVHGAIEAGSLFKAEAGEAALAPIAWQRTLPTLRNNAFAGLTLEQLQYVAPEAGQGYSPATDFYALGVVLYLMICGKPPFQAADRDQLLALKTATNGLEVGKRHQHLLPLFKGLLTPVADQRIQTASEFEKSLTDCIMQLKRKGDAVVGLKRKNSSPAGESTDEQESSPASYTVPTGISVILIILVGGYFIYQLMIKPTPSHTSRPSFSIETIPSTTTQQSPPAQREPATASESAATPSTPSAPDDSAEDLRKQARDELQVGNLGTALLSINTVLRGSPGDEAAMQLKREIESAINIRSILRKAEQQVADLKLTKPAGDNAFETYQSLRNLLPPDDPRINQGLYNIATYYHGLATRAYQDANHEEALELIGIGLGVAGEHQELSTLQSQVIERLNLIERERQQRRLAAQKRAQETQARAQQQAELERQRAAAAARQERARELEQQRLAEQREQERQRQQRINNLMVAASNRLETEKLALPVINASRDDYQELLLLDANDDRLVKLKQQIIDAYAVLAIAQKDAQQYDAALATLQQGFLLNPNSANLALIQKEVQALIDIREQPAQAPVEPPAQQTVPIIGTF